KVLEGVALRDLVLSWVRKVVEDAVNERCESRHPDNWDIEGLVGQLGTVFPLPPFGEIPPDEFGETKEAVVDRLMQYAETAYQALLNDIQFDIASNMYRVQLRTEPPVPTPPPVMAINRARASGVAAPVGAASGGSPNGGGSPAPVPAGKLGRNDPCWCGSGKKYKKCHGR